MNVDLYKIVQRNAHAKINLSLEVIGKRDDGYHNIVSIMQLVELHDSLRFSLAGDLTLESNDPDLGAAGDGNLVLRAASALQDLANVTEGARIRLEKRIPVAAGLGGGSSDAAATLLGLSELWNISLPEAELHSLAATLGSDVPFFLDGPTALVEGRGEILTTIPSLPPAWVVLVCPAYRVEDKTRRLYASLRKQDMTGGSVTHQLLSALLHGEFPGSNLLHNAFERAAYAEFEGLDRLSHRILRISGRNAHLSGSGPTLYVLFSEKEERRAAKLYESLQADGLETYLTRTVRKT